MAPSIKGSLHSTVSAHLKIASSQEPRSLLSGLSALLELNLRLHPQRVWALFLRPKNRQVEEVTLFWLVYALHLFRDAQYLPQCDTIAAIPFIYLNSLHPSSRAVLNAGECDEIRALFRTQQCWARCRVRLYSGPSEGWIPHLQAPSHCQSICRQGFLGLPVYSLAQLLLSSILTFQKCAGNSSL